MSAERTEPAITVSLPLHEAAMLLERADHERRYFMGKHAVLQSIRGGLPDISQEEVEALATYEAWALIANTLRVALFGGPDLDAGNHYAGMPPREPGVYSIRVGGR